MDKAINIDCYGRYHGDQHVQLRSGEICNYWYDKKHSGGYSLALFLNQAAISNDVYRYPRNRRVCLLTESPSNIAYRHVDTLEQNFPVIFTHNEMLLAKGSPYRKLLLGTSWIDVPEETNSLQKKNLVSFIGSIQHGDEYGYALRKQVVQSCLSDDRVDCFGKGICEIDSKLTGLRHYAFSIAMENVQENHYFSEKLIDCILTETVPIYWGCPGISDYFDLRGMITFQTLEELQGVLAGLSMGQYLAMLPYVKLNKQRAIEQRWHSLAGLYARLGEQLLEEFDVGSQRVKPSGRVRATLRRLIWSQNLPYGSHE